MNQSIVIHWFRQDLRLSDNPGLFQAAKEGHVLPIYILDDQNANEYQLGSASRWWLHHSLHALNDTLDGKLSVYSGDPKTILYNLTKTHTIKAVHWNRCYEPWCIARDTKIRAMLNNEGIAANSFNGSLLWEPWDVVKDDGSPYKAFTPFYRKAYLGTTLPRKALPMPHPLTLIDTTANAQTIKSLELLPDADRDKELASHWDIGEKAAQSRLSAFLDESIYHYKDGRNFPAKPYVSRLSPHLRFGELSPNQIWYAARLQGDNKNVDHFCSELGWREFSYSLLYHNPDLPYKNLQSKFDSFAWRDDADTLLQWQKGQTGIPIVDAGMRQLWQTGYIHNRVRMIVGSFLVKNLLIHWHHGSRWFWNCLVDADLANNSASWQWIAGCGADAAPYFRIFNPTTQGKTFDVDGTYTRHYVPELKHLPDKYLFDPWEAPETVLENAGVILGKTYPRPIVDLKISHNRALEAFGALKQNS